MPRNSSSGQGAHDFESAKVCSGGCVTEGRRLRVLHIITRLILGGAQENTLATARGLAERWGFDVTLATGPALGPEGSLIEEAGRLGVRLRIVREMRREVHPLFDIITFVKLYFLIALGHYDVVHTHSAKAGVLGRVAARLAGVPVVVHTIHGLPFHKYQNRVLNALYVNCERIAGPFADRIVTVADEMTRKAVAAGVARERRFETIRSGMDLDRFLEAGKGRDEARRQLGIGEGELVVGKVGRLFPLKGHEFFMAAAGDIVKEVPEARFLLVGDGILRQRLEEEAGRLGLRDRFVFTGLVPREQIPAMIAAMDVVVHTSLREGLARVLPQALAVGRPVVAFDIDGAREVVAEGKTGALVEPGDVAGLVRAVVRILREPEARARMGELGRKRVDPEWRESEMVDSIARLYLRLAKEKGVRGCTRPANGTVGAG